MKVKIFEYMNFEYNVWAAVWRNFYFIYFKFLAETYPERHGLKTFVGEQ